MKTVLLAFVIATINIKMNFLPKPDLLIMMGIFMLVDFVTGLGRAIIEKKTRSSTGFRQTLVKFIQYGTAILIGMAISYLGNEVSAYNKSWEGITRYMNWFNNGLLVFINLIEITSILENSYAMNKTNKFSRHFIKPALKILTIELKRNPISKISLELEGEAEIESIHTETKKQ